MNYIPCALICNPSDQPGCERKFYKHGNLLVRGEAENKTKQPLYLQHPPSGPYITLSSFHND